MDVASRVKDGKKLQGLVLDLRGNLGGVLEQAIKVTNDFVESGVIARMTGLKGHYVEEKKATKEGMATNVPLAVLIDERTAAGAEVVTAALKDLGRAIVLGQRTAGEGTVQVLYVYRERDGGPPIALLRLTIGSIGRSSGLGIDGVGVVPDVSLVGAADSDAGVAKEEAAPPAAPLRTPSLERPLAVISYGARGSPSAVLTPEGGRASVE